MTHGLLGFRVGIPLTYAANVGMQRLIGNQIILSYSNGLLLSKLIMNMKFEEKTHC